MTSLENMALFHWVRVQCWRFSPKAMRLDFMANVSRGYLAGLYRCTFKNPETSGVEDGQIIENSGFSIAHVFIHIYSIYKIVT